MIKCSLGRIACGFGLLQLRFAHGELFIQVRGLVPVWDQGPFVLGDILVTQLKTVGGFCLFLVGFTRGMCKRVVTRINRDQYVALLEGAARFQCRRHGDDSARNFRLQSDRSGREYRAGSANPRGQIRGLDVRDLDRGGPFAWWAGLGLWFCFDQDDADSDGSSQDQDRKKDSKCPGNGMSFFGCVHS